MGINDGKIGLNIGHGKGSYREMKYPCTGLSYFWFLIFLLFFFFLCQKTDRFRVPEHYYSFKNIYG